MIPRRLATLAVALVTLAVPAGAASAASLLPPPGKVFTGVSGGPSIDPYARQVHHRPSVLGMFTSWNSLSGYVFNSAEAAGTPALMLHISTTDGYGMKEKITPGASARGRGDHYLVALNQQIAGYGKPTYVRLLAEMNQANNAYSAFNRDGSSRGAAHSTKAYQAAWRRSTLILRGGPVAAIDARLHALHLPAVRRVARDDVLPAPQIAMAWVPQTRGSPDIPANMPERYWPGNRYVDWIGTDFYSRFPNFDWLSQFYASHPHKPFLFGEWALWGADSAGFVDRLFGWMRTHKRVRIAMYNQGAMTHGPFRLNQYPQARAELRRKLRAKRYR
jgi:hypothetical protein